MTTDLRKIHCLGCEGGLPALTKDEVKELLNKTPGWTVNNEGTWISSHFNFKDFYKTMAFVNAIAWIANLENHHPDMEVGYNYCHIKYTTHAVNGLTQNDFICAAKINALEAAILCK